ncbi:hypothetical protein ACLOJK_037669 [Asimina triloba]
MLKHAVADITDVLNGEQLACCDGLGKVAAAFAGGREDVATDRVAAGGGDGRRRRMSVVGY